MKNTSFIILSLLTIVAFTYCSSSKNTEKNMHQINHFKVLEKNYSYWVGGQKGVRGISVEISIDNPSVLLDSIYSNGKSEKFKKDVSSKTNKFVASFTYFTEKQDLNLSEKPSEEYGNQPPMAPKFSEALVTYIFKNQKYSVVISEFKQIENLNNFQN